MECSCRRNSPYTGTLAGLSRAEPLPSLFISPVVHSFYFPCFTWQWFGDMDLLRVSYFFLSQAFIFFTVFLIIVRSLIHVRYLLYMYFESITCSE